MRYDQPIGTVVGQCGYCAFSKVPGSFLILGQTSHRKPTHLFLLFLDHVFWIKPVISAVRRVALTLSRQPVPTADFVLCGLQRPASSRQETERFAKVVVWVYRGRSSRSEPFRSAHAAWNRLCKSPNIRSSSRGMTIRFLSGSTGYESQTNTRCGAGFSRNDIAGQSLDARAHLGAWTPWLPPRVRFACTAARRAKLLDRLAFFIARGRIVPE